jgi:glycosyltransferase involved in cell wall biosynthesis
MTEIDTSPEPPRFSDSPIGWFASRYRVLLLRRAARRFVEILRYAPLRPPPRQKFHIVSAQRNMGETVLRCLDSVHSQDYPKHLIEHVFFDDASTDATPEIINKWLAEHPDNSVNFIHNGERVGMLANNLAGFHRAADTDVGIELNGDDWLPDPGVLPFLNKVYDDDDVWMTYNTLRQTDGTILFQVPPPREVRRANSYRRAPWMTSHLRTFRIPLYLRVPKVHLIDPATGAYWDMAPDMAVYLAMLEMAGDHARHICRITCTYHPHAMSEHVRDREEQLAADRRIRRLPPCQPLASLVGDESG